MLHRWIGIAVATLLTPAAWADYAVLDNGETLNRGEFKFTGTGQVLTENAGLNLAARADMGINDQFGLRALAGFGKTDLFVGSLIRWTPIKDTESQPMMGGNVGLLYLNDGDYSDLVIRAEPLISKIVKIEEVVLTPYASAPVSMRMRKVDDGKDKNEVALQLVLGTQLRIPQIIEQVQFIGEIGIDLNEAPGYISLGAIYYLDTDGSPATESESESITQ